MENTFAVIMAGGKGERFWPLSTSKTPKQMLSLVGGKPLITVAVERLTGLIPSERILIVTSASLVDATREAVPALPAENVVGEPVGRDTAAAVALASALVQNRAEDGVFCILTADHIIRDIDIFHDTIRSSFEIAAKNDVLITMGITPTFASTGFGYVEAGEAFPSEGDVEFRRATRFVEKPEIETAKQYIAAGNYCWNAGMFVWSVAAIQKALSKHTPALRAMIDALAPHIGTGEFLPTLAAEYDKLERISIDYAVMEPSDNIIMACATFYWDDVGSWVSLENHFDKDANDNVVIGNCEALDATGNIVVSDERVTALIGVKDLVVVQAGNATLICSRDKAQDVKKMVKLLGEKGYADLL